MVRDYALRRKDIGSYTGSYAEDERLYPGLNADVDLWLYLVQCQEWHVKAALDMMGNDS